MYPFRKLLLASHGTQGAQFAEQFATRMLVADCQLHHLLIVPDCWKGMMGDDWLNNAATQAEFGQYLENELQTEIAGHCERVEQLCQFRALHYQFHLAHGDPASCLLTYVAQENFDAVVVGSLRPKSVLGLRSLMDVSLLQRQLHCPLIIVPFGYHAANE